MVHGYGRRPHMTLSPLARPGKAIALEAQIDLWSALIVHLLISFRIMSFMHCSSSTAGTSVRLTRSWAGCPDCILVSGLSPDGEVFLLTSPFIDRYPGLLIFHRIK
jgi:hypothetical protein